METVRHETPLSSRQILMKEQAVDFPLQLVYSDIWMLLTETLLCAISSGVSNSLDVFTSVWLVHLLLPVSLFGVHLFLVNGGIQRRRIGRNYQRQRAFTPKNRYGKQRETASALHRRQYSLYYALICTMCDC